MLASYMLYPGKFIKCVESFKNEYVVYLKDHLYKIPEDPCWHPEIGYADITDHFGEDRFSTPLKIFDMKTIYHYVGYAEDDVESINGKKLSKLVQVSKAKLTFDDIEIFFIHESGLDEAHIKGCNAVVKLTALGFANEMLKESKNEFRN